MARGPLGTRLNDVGIWISFMSASSFRCPHCATTLRVRDRKYIGRQIACPECQKPVLIVADGPRGLAGRPAETQPPAAARPWRERVLRRWSPRRTAGTADPDPSTAARTDPPGGPA